MATVVISPCNVANYPAGGGHSWVYMQYVQGLRQLGCDVYWLEQFRRGGDADREAEALATFFRRMERFGLGGKAILYTGGGTPGGNAAPYEYLGMGRCDAECVIRRADLLLNFHYAIDPALLSGFRRTALVDIDPGLLQFWMSAGQLHVSPHDRYFTIGETVGTPAARFPDCGLRWIHIRPPVCLNLWPSVFDARAEAFTTISGWWGNDGKGGKGEWVTDGHELLYENNKRVSFLEYVTLPHLTDQRLELALCLGTGDSGQGEPPEGHGASQPRKAARAGVTDYRGDAEDQERLERNGWRIRHARDVAGCPESYQSYIQQSRGEFSCAKPSCMQFQNAWISDRTFCYLASGKPAVVQHTGPSAFLPEGEGLFRFRTLEEAAGALASVNMDYERHCRTARGIAEAFFDAGRVLEALLNSV